MLAARVSYTHQTNDGQGPKVPILPLLEKARPSLFWH